MHRSYTKNIDLRQKTFTITDQEEIHHIRDVLRLKSNDTFTCFNGNGEEADVKILEIYKNEIMVETIALRRVESVGPQIILACAIPKKSKFEWIIEKATELGASEIFPLLTQRTEIKLSSQQAEKKQQRYLTVAVNAAKQSKRLTIPTIHEPMTLTSCLKQLPPETAVFIPCLIGERRELREVIQEKKAECYCFLIGPEGDFTNQEVAAAVESGAIPVSLGKTVLKVETAALSVMAFADLLLQS